jgi:hypothetical protein
VLAAVEELDEPPPQAASNSRKSAIDAIDRFLTISLQKQLPDGK